MIGELFDDVELFDNRELAKPFRLPTFARGTKALLLKDGSAIVGQLDMTLTVLGGVVQTSNKSNTPFIKLRDNVLFGRGFKISGSLIFNDSASFKQFRADALEATQSTYVLAYGAGLSERLSCTFTPKITSEAFAIGDKLTSSIELSSHGTPSY